MLSALPLVAGSSNASQEKQKQDNRPPISAHSNIRSYDGPATCIACHEDEAEDALHSVHMRWNGPTPDLINTDGAYRGKGYLGTNTFCTYAMSSGNLCFSCHVRLDGNAPHPPEVTDVDCLMCHSEEYQRYFVLDDREESKISVVQYDGEPKDYMPVLTDDDGNAVTETIPSKGQLAQVARNVHMPTRTTCLRCHAKAGGGDWTKRGDLGMSSIAPDISEDVHLSPQGADLHCVNCHIGESHRIGGRGIDLRQTEAQRPMCADCHSSRPHSNSDLNRHAQGQVSCQVCHIRTYAKGGATELSRDWLHPEASGTVCFGQGGYIGLEIKEEQLTPEYVWFSGKSYVYNVGEKIYPDDQGIYHTAQAIGESFDGLSQIFPIKRHFSTLPVTPSNQIVPPSIMWMFMTGDFDQAVQKGLQEWNLGNQYEIVTADAEMLITHGVDQTDNAPSCRECHDMSGHTLDGMLPFSDLGYHTLPEAVLNCTLCHEHKSSSWEKTHAEHRDEIVCTSCHTTNPTGLIASPGILCSKCHEREHWEDESHMEHIEEGIACSACHTFDGQ